MANSDIFTRKDIEKPNIEFYSNDELSAVDGWQTVAAQSSNYEILLNVSEKLEYT